VTFLKIPEQTNRTQGIAQGITDEDETDKHCEDFIRESCGVLHELVQIHHCRNDQEERHPQSAPRIETQKGDIQGLGHVV